MASSILTDSCFWLGLIDPNDQYHDISNNILELIENNDILFPWPCLYETISTHLTRRRGRMIYFEKILSRPNITLVEDDTYKIEALNNVFENNRIMGFTYSLTDSVIREILKDINIRVNYLVTFNEKDFKDLCDLRRIEIVSK